MSYDALLLLSFGGPEGPDDVLPFLENVVRGKAVPPERLVEVAEHYRLFDGVSPLNAENRALLAALVAELNSHGPHLPVYWGNRNWHPLLTDTVRQMADDGVQRALAFVTSAFGSYSGCRQYREDIDRARQEVGPHAPQIDKLRLFNNHPGFIEAMAERTAAAIQVVPSERRNAAKLIFTAHSIPGAQAERSPYDQQLREACRLVVERLSNSPRLPAGDGTENVSPRPSASEGTENVSPRPLAGEGQGVRAAGNSCGHCDPPDSPCPNPLSKGHGTARHWDLVFQSRSGPPTQPWLGPDIADHLRSLAGKVEDVVIVPIGFLSEHMEVVYDLDVVVGQLCEELGISMVRAEVVGTHPRCIRMIRELILERVDPSKARLSLGPDGPWPDVCPADCCRP